MSIAARTAASGALSLAAAACRPEITAVAAVVPFLTGIRDSLRLGGSYPYEEIKDYLRQRPESEAHVLPTLDYIDTLNFADRIGAPTLLSAGLSDDVGPPETAYALYNQVASRAGTGEGPPCPAMSFAPSNACG